MVSCVHISSSLGWWGVAEKHSIKWVFHTYKLLKKFSSESMCAHAHTSGRTRERTQAGSAQPPTRGFIQRPWDHDLRQYQSLVLN